MIQGLNYIILHVPSIEEARAFYTDKLGFVADEEMPGFVQFKHHGSGAQFALEEQKNAGPLQNIELWWFVDNADITHTELVSRGVEVVDSPKEEPFGRAFIVKGPAGHLVHFLQIRAQG